MDFIIKMKISTKLKHVVNKKKEIQSIPNASGLVVGILGRDGCGKSTFIEQLAPVLEPYFKGIDKFKKMIREATESARVANPGE